MTLVTRRVRRPGSLLLSIPAIFALFTVFQAQAQTLQCTTSATPLMVHSEGLAEPSGNIILNCAGVPAGKQMTTNITLTYNVAVTNRLVNGAPDAVLSIDSGSGPVNQTVTPTLPQANMLAFNGVTFTPSAAGTAIIQISNVRLNVSILAPGQSATANLSTSLPLSAPSVTVAIAQTGLLATYSSSGITCTGSPLPAVLNFINLIGTGTNFASTRVTEGFGNAFIVKDPTSDAGTRIMLKFANFPTGSAVYVPDFIAGSNSSSPTKAGDLGGPISPGVYLPGTLLLARVIGTDSTGAGGSVVGNTSAVTMGTVNPVTLTSGAGIAVYEVIDANNGAQEDAQIPTFVGLPANSPEGVATEAVSLAPVNTTPTAAAGVPVPRFLANPPPSDCQVVGDCGASYFPVLSATSTSLQFNVSTSGQYLVGYIQVNNTGGGNLEFTASVTYQGSQQGWLTVINQGLNINHTTLQVQANPITLPQGTYQATVTVNAGGAGSQTFPVTLVVGAPPITISSVVNAASFQAGPLVAGSLATIKGSGFTGKVVSVTFSGMPGTVLFGNATQINVQVPAALASNTSTQVAVTVDGNSSAPVTVTLAAIAPGIFGVLNQDNSLNSSSNPAPGGTVIQIFATGLISPVSSGAIVVGLGNQGIPTLYSGSQSNGLQQVNAQLPTNASSIPGVLVVCGTSTTSQLVCSPAVTLYTK